MISLEQLSDNHLAKAYFILKDEKNAGLLTTSTVTLNERNVGNSLSYTETGTEVFPLGVFKGGELIGLSVINNVNPVKRSGHYRFLIIDSEHQTKGYGCIAGALTMRFCFQDLNLNRVYTRTWSNNSNMDGIYKAFFREEGLEKQEAYINGEYVDRHLWGILKHEFNRSRCDRIIRGNHGRSDKCAS